jgi:hypothetical protein
VFGGGTGYAVGRLAKHHVIDTSLLTWSDQVAVFLGVSLSGAGGVVIAATLLRSLSKTLIEPSVGRSLTPRIAHFYRLQAGVMVLAGVMLLLPVLGVSLPDLGARRQAFLALVVVLFALQTYGNLLIWRRSDEFLRKVIADTGAVCFWLLQGALFLWAAAERLGLRGRLSSWDAVAVLMLVYTAASISIAIRRGAR